MKHRIRGIFALVTLTVTVATCPAEEEFIFPVGLWVTNNIWQPPDEPFDYSSVKLVDLRSKGVEMILLGGVYVDNLKGMLARADSFGFRVYAVPKEFQVLAKYGHDPVFDSLNPYFKNHNQIRYSSSTFNDTLDIKVS